MARLSGKTGSVSFNAAPIVNINSIEVDYTGDAVEVTGMDDSGKRSYISGLTGWSGTFEGFLESTATLPLPGASAAIAIDMTGDVAASADNYSGTAIITGMKVSTTVDGAVKYSASFQGTGTLTIA
jgi:predicted secreted protein